MTPANPLRAAVEELRQVTGWLMASLTAPAHRGPQLSDEKLSELAAAAKLADALKRRGDDRSGMLVPLGETPAPLDLDVADLLVEILDLAAGHSGLRAPATSFDDPRPHLTAIITLTRTGRTAGIDSDRLIDGCEHLTVRAHRKLGLLPDGQLLDALCPWCGGRTSKHPTGGARTMRVRMKLPPGKRTAADVDPADIRWYVVCEGGLCDPPDADCGERLHGRPAWPLVSEGEWLADRIERAAAS